MKTELKYRTFDELLYEVNTDFVMYNNEGLIEPAQLIKVAQRVNYDLGLRIHGTKEKMLEIENKKVRLPNDFYVLNYAYLAGQYKVTYRVPSGRTSENMIVNGQTCIRCYKPESDCVCEATYTQECQNGENIYVQVVEKRKTETRVYETFERVRIATDTGRGDALNDSDYVAYIKNNYIYTNISQGKLYISYQGNLEDSEGNLLVLDHPMINEYYEYAIKQRLLENLFINGEDVAQKLQLIEPRLRAARNNALSIVNTPDFAEMKKLWELNRKGMYHKYYDMFKSSEPLINIYSGNGRVEDECEDNRMVTQCATSSSTTGSTGGTTGGGGTTPPTVVTSNLLTQSGLNILTQSGNNITI